MSETCTTASHDIRITTHGKVHAWITFALDFLQKNPNTPLILHTLPAAKTNSVHPAHADAPSPANPPPADSTPPQATKSRMHPSMSTIPRLITVVEIIKREYLKTLDVSLAQEGKLSGLHQYNEIGQLEAESTPSTALSAEEQRQEAIALALSGKRHLRQHKVAYMKVTLCQRELPHLVSSGATYQKPELRALSKSARARLKRKLKKTEGNGS